jgi:tRNA(Ile)-lysidine synthase TilS/MesJ
MGDIAGKGCEILIPFSERKTIEEIEHSIVTKYRRHIWSRFMKSIIEFKMAEEGDKIAVAVSGGKDSMLMAKLFQELQRHGKARFELEFIVADPGYHEDVRKLMIDNCEYMGIPIKIFESRIFEICEDIAKDYPCFMCAKMRRGALS